jgi:hypothetical protein
LPVVIVMRTAQYGATDDLLPPGWLSPSHWLAPDPLSNPLVRSRMVDAFLVDLHLAMGVSLAQGQT